MNIAVVHYHLQTGGISRVIESAHAGLSQMPDCAMLVFSGEPPDSGIDRENVIVIPGLGFQRGGNTQVAESLADALREASRARFGSLPDVWHFHNHSIVRNAMMPSVVHNLATSGQKVLLQIHDFPEDGRPQNYAEQRSFFESDKVFEQTLYPKAPQVHYAAINQRDFGFLRNAGVRSGNLHLLPNPIHEPRVTSKPSERPFAKGKLFALYPSRGVRRKNLGELLLLSLLNRDRVEFATSLPPARSDAQTTHELWRNLARRLELPVTFGIADRGEFSYSDLLGWADFFVTTSIAEGFGLAFLEPWIIEKSVVGRNLERITRDFSDQGIRLNHLYSRLEIPVDWLDETALSREMDNSLRQSYLAYDRSLPKTAVKEAWQVWVQDGKIDFGVLSESFQMEVLEKISASPELIERVVAPVMKPCREEGIAERRELVRRFYSVESYGRRLHGIYQKMKNSKTGSLKHLPTKKILDQFLDPKRLNLMRT